MFNKDFLKNLTILYVEDDEITRLKLAKILKRIFKDVLLASNGLEGYILFQEQQLANNTIDLILSDINMPKMNGIEMLENIRNLDTEIPIIYTTARTESEHLLNAIELNVNHYVLKPIDTEDIISRIQKVCEKKYYQNMIQAKKNELEKYLGIIDNVAIVLKMNSKKEITFVNPLLIETFKYEKEEILNKKLEEFIHKDISKSLIVEIWETIEKGITWCSDIKYQDKDKNDFYINSTIFKITKDEGLEYIYIGFLSTDNVNKQREFKKRVISNYQEFKKNKSDDTRKIDDLKSDLSNKNDTEKYLQDLLSEAKQKNQQLLSQIDFYEKEINNKNSSHLKSLDTSKNSLEKISSSYKKALMTIDSIKKDNEHLSKDNVLKSETLTKQEEMIEMQKEIIIDLRDTIKNIDE